MADPIIETVQPLVTLDALKVALGIELADTARDAGLQSMIEFASGQITKHCGRSFVPEVVVGELHDGDGTNLLTPRHTPIISVQALSIDGRAIDPVELKIYFEFIRLEDSEYSPRLRTSGRIFPVGRQNVDLDYTHGYVKVPYEISRACIAQVMFLMNTLKRQGITTETENGMMTSFSQMAITNMWQSANDLAPAVRSICAHFSRTKVAAI
jgi:hypothetical protein